jgi:hypothetical protein
MNSRKESTLLKNKFKSQPQNMTKKNSKRDSEDSLAVLLSSRLEVPQKSKFKN